ncbi:MAG: hypothetical protein H0V30_10955 [Chitinophagaceae bacterium]|nr:hypothetical protein [Chitinophagaceae bacterium]
MITIAKWTIIVFGIFLILAGLLMLFLPKKAGETLRKAGSTNFINYAEITIRIIPATALILFADFSKYPVFFKILGWFMLITSLVLYFIPRRIHHGYSLHWAEKIKPRYFQFIAPFAWLFGAIIIYCVL